MSTIKWLYNFTTGKRRKLFCGLLFIIANAVVEILKVETQKGIIDVFLNTKEITTIIRQIAVLSILYILSSLLFYAIGVVFQDISFYTCKKMVMELHTKIQAMSIIDFDNSRFGKWVAFFSDIDNLGKELFLVSYKLSDFLRLIIMTVIIYIVNRKILFFLIVINFIFVIFMRKILPKIQKTGKEIIEKRHELLVRFEEGNSGLREIVVNNYHIVFMDILNKSYKRYLKAINKDVHINNQTFLLATAVKWAGLSFSIYILYQNVITQKISVGMFWVIYQYVSQFSELFRQVNNYIYEIAGTIVKTEKIKDEIEKISVIEYEGGITLHETIKSINMGKFCFSFNDNKTVFDGMNGEIAIGKRNIIVGESGVGKSTLIGILLKNYMLTDGNCMINDRYSLEQISLRSWLKKISIVQQTPYIFCDTLRNNILLGKENISDEEILKICEAVLLSDFIKQLHAGLDTLIGEGGFDISGGQRQRFAIARALLNDSEILILDEAMSALDEHGRDVISKNIDSIYNGRTQIIITHQLSDMDRTCNIIKI